MAGHKETNIVLQCPDGTLKPFICGTPNYNSSLKSIIKKHVASINKEKRTLKCEICDFTCRFKNSLRKHIASIHKEKDPIQSDISNQNCSLVNNKIKSAPLRIKPLKCNNCDFECFDKDDMKKHFVHAHEIIKLSECEIRDDNGLGKSNMKNHRCYGIFFQEVSRGVKYFETFCVVVKQGFSQIFKVGSP